MQVAAFGDLDLEQRAAALKELGAAAGQINILLNDKCVAFPDAVPVLKGGRTMVPMRAAVEAMGAVVDYDAATRTASVKMGDVSFTHVIGTDVITLSDGSTVKMDIVSYIDKGRTMVPLRFSPVQHTPRVEMHTLSFSGATTPSRPARTL